MSTLFSVNFQPTNDLLARGEHLIYSYPVKSDGELRCVVTNINTLNFDRKILGIFHPEEDRRVIGWVGVFYQHGDFVVVT